MPLRAGGIHGATIGALEILALPVVSRSSSVPQSALKAASSELDTRDPGPGPGQTGVCRVRSRSHSRSGDRSRSTWPVATSPGGNVTQDRTVSRCGQGPGFRCQSILDRKTAWDRNSAALGPMAVASDLHRVRTFVSLQPGSLDGHGVIAFSRSLRRHLRAPVLLVWDRLPVHLGLLCRSISAVTAIGWTSTGCRRMRRSSTRRKAYEATSTAPAWPTSHPTISGSWRRRCAAGRGASPKWLASGMRVPAMWPWPG